MFATLSPISPIAPTPAEAFCKGVDNPYSWSVGWAAEYVRYNTTCDGEHDYYGKVKDAETDGNCVDLYSKDDWGSPWTWEARECTTGSWENFYYEYSDGSAYFKTCKHISGACSDPKYAWGF